uniref:BACON domain-containing protein n=1 Tax=Prevotella sp. GTC17260 TaxID=3236796 RepID=A0AB33JDF9_9BACT
MKRILYIIVFILPFIVASCVKEEYWYHAPELKAKELTISANLDSTSFEILGGSWNNIAKATMFQDGKEVIMLPMATNKENGLSEPGATYTADWLTIKHTDNQREIRVIAKPNNGSRREAHIEVDYGTAIGTITLIQKGKGEK